MRAWFGLALAAVVMAFAVTVLGACAALLASSLRSCDAASHAARRCVVRPRGLMMR